MNQKVAKEVRKVVRSQYQDLSSEIRESFQQDFDFFTSTLLAMSFKKRLKFCFNVMAGKRPSAG